MESYHPLPLLLSSFVGREAEREGLSRLLREVRLVTVAGAGGSGKTRLAIEVARAISSEFEHPAVFCDLGAAGEGGLALHALGNALDIHEASAQTMLDAIVHRLAGANLLLVLDNCEVVAAEVGRLAQALLRGCPGISLLATSRVPLGVSGERVWRLPPRELPAADGPAGEWRGADAVALFADRVEAGHAGYAWDELRSAAAVRICRRLDGIPLAIELAAARAGSLAVEDLERELEGGLALLNSTAAAELRRHDTLATTVDWSYRMLLQREQRIFRRLSVFVGGASIEEAVAICGHDAAPGEVVQALAALVEHSMAVLREPAGSPARYALLEPMRDFARAELAASGELGDMVQRHRAHFVAFAEHAARALRGREQVTAMQLFDAEIGNLRAALTLAVREGGDLESASRFVVAMDLYWRIRARYRESLEWSSGVLAQLPEDSPWRGRVLRTAGCTHSMLGEPARAVVLLQEAVELARERADPAELGEALCWLGEAYERLHDADHAFVCAEEAGPLIHEGDHWLEALRLRLLAHAEKVRSGDMMCVEEIHQREYEHCLAAGDSLFTGNVMNCLGEFARWRGEYGLAEMTYKESLGRRQAVGDRGGTVLTLGNLGLLATQTGQAGLALEYISEALELSVRIGSPLHHAFLALGLAGVASLIDMPADGARLAGVMRSLNRGPYLDPPDQQAADAMAARCRSAIGEAEYLARESAGALVASAAVVDECRSFIERAREALRRDAPPPGGEPGGLSKRELEIVRMVAAGMSNREIADRLVLSPRTVETHVANAYGKLGVTNRAEATARSIQLGIMPAARNT